MNVTPELDSDVDSESLLEQLAPSFTPMANGVSETPPPFGGLSQQQQAPSTPRSVAPGGAAAATVGPAQTRRGGDQEQPQQGLMDGQGAGRARGASWMRSCGHGFEAGSPCAECECMVCLEQSPDAVLLECGHGFEPFCPHPVSRACGPVIQTRLS
jgi:hypothetical protein